MTSRETGVRVITAEEAGALLRKQILGADIRDALAVDCGVLRGCLWALSGGSTPVHVLRLLNLAVHSSPDSIIRDTGDAPAVRERLRTALGELADMGDAVSLANGRWLPAPAREVKLGTADDARLVLGGFPTSLLPARIADAIQHRGAFRRTTSAAVATALGLKEEPLDLWVGAPPPDLSVWTKSAFEGEYEGYVEQEGGRRFSIYAPQMAGTGAPQYRRWFECGERLSGRFLARREAEFGMRQYRAVELVNGKVARVMRLRLGVGDLRRLMYGLDAATKNPVRVRFEVHRDSCTALLGSEVPNPERRFFAAVGEVSFPADKYYPRTWRFPRQYAPDVLARFESLGVDLQSSSVGNTRQ